MNKKIGLTLAAAVNGFCEQADAQGGPLVRALGDVFELDAPFLEKVARLDDAFSESPGALPLKEVIFDLLLVNFFTADVQKLEADYLDSPEWEAIEEQTLDRGTEILNLLLYLNECTDEEIDPELGDYLNEFLLVDDDEFQDEHHIYEDVIANQVLVESSYAEIARVAEGIAPDSEMKDLFYPVMSFFYDQKPSGNRLDEYIRYSTDPAFDNAVYRLLSVFNSH